MGTAQEEVGLRGATVAALSVRPDIGIAADITGAGDTPGFPATHRIAELGKGVAIKQQDASVICSTALVEFIRNLAEEKDIHHQMEILVRGGTDTSAMQKFGGDTHATCLSIHQERPQPVPSSTATTWRRGGTPGGIPEHRPHLPGLNHRMAGPPAAPPPVTHTIRVMELSIPD